MPALADGEFFFATDTLTLWVGWMGGTVRVRQMPVQIQDSNGNNLTSTGNALDVNLKSSSDTTPIPISASSAIPISASSPIPISAPSAIPVSAASTLPISAAALPLPAGAATDSSVTNGNQKTQIVNGTGNVADVQPHGTQGSLFLCVQDAKDSGRTAVVINIPEVASVTTEALLNINIMKGATQTTAQTGYTVTTGKTLRIQALRLKARFTAPSTTVTFAQVLLTLRNAAAVAANNVLFGVKIDCAANTSSEADTITFPDGWELPAGSVIAISQLASGTTLTVSGELIGFEY